MGEGQEPVVSGVPGHSAEVTTLATATTPTLPGTEPPGWPTSLRSCATSRAPYHRLRDPNRGTLRFRLEGAPRS
jgi:hypothetical protein